MFEKEYREFAETILAEVKEANENDAAVLADHLQEVCEEFIEGLKESVSDEAETLAEPEPDEEQEQDEQDSSKKPDPEEVV